MLNFAVGPVMMDPEILNIGAEPLPYFRTEEFSELTFECEKLLKKLTKAPDDARVIFLTGSGTAAMEACVLNLFTADDKVLIVNGGSFGTRFKQICDTLEIPSEEIHLEHGEPLTEKHLAEYDNKGFTAFLVNVHETSTGVLYDMNMIHHFCERNHLLLVADAISSFLADPYNITEYGVSATIISTQKGLALPPGMSYVILTKNAIERTMTNTVKSIYFDFKDYLKNGERGQTPFTPAVGIMIQLHKRLQMIDTAGIDSVVKNTHELAVYFREKIAELPFEIASPSPSNAMTPLHPTGKMAADEIYHYVKENYGVFLCPNGGDLAKKIFRVGHIGYVRKEDIDSLVDIFDELKGNDLF